jgi:acyl transferase domain-containing protein
MNDVAIVGMACIFPGAGDLETYWRNIVSGVDAIQDVPASRWDPVFYDPASKAPDRFYCKRGGFIDDFAEFDALSFGVMPVEAHGADPDQLLSLQVAAQALVDAGYDTTPFAREGTGVIVGRGGYMTAGLRRIDQRVRAAEQLAANLRLWMPQIDEEAVQQVKTSFQEQLGPYGADSAIGLVPNLAASRIANRLDLHGPAYTLDAACASALLAIDHACHQLNVGGCDLILAGGVHLVHDVTFWSVFSQIGALSRQQQIRPFHRDADGLLIGEGIGFVVLERLADAVKHERRIYAVIRGTGVASDGRATGLMNPRIEGQLLALERAWTAAGADPGTIGLIEAHGTGTPAGDAAELRTLARFFGATPPGKPRAVIGSVKSMIGHTMPAAGIAGVIKAALAVHYAQLPPTLHCEEPHDALHGTRFRPIEEAEPWESNGAARMAGVNAFGFGGINVHVVLEENERGRLTPTHRRTVASAGGIDLALPRSPALLTLAAPTPGKLLEALNHGNASPSDTLSAGDAVCRLALFDPTPARLDRARSIISRGEPWRGREDLWFVPSGLLAQGGKVAFLFPGVDSRFQPQIDDIAAALRLTAPSVRRDDSLQQKSLAVLKVNRILHKAILRLGIVPDAIAGHSIGEWSAIIAAGVVSESEVDQFISNLLPDSVVFPDVTFLAAGCGAARASAEIADLDLKDSIAISHDNCPRQVIICGGLDGITKVAARLRSSGVLCSALEFQSGFHTPLFRDHVGPFREKLGCFRFGRPAAPLWSATTCRQYPEDPRALEELLIEHLVEPVRYRELVDALYNDGCRVFLQIGSGSLTGFVGDTLRERAHVALPANVPGRSGLGQLRRVAAALFVEGLNRVRLDGKPAVSGTARQTLKLSLGVPLVTVSTLRSPSRFPESPLLDEFKASFDEITASLDAVQQAWRSSSRSASALRRRSSTRSVVSLETLPYVMDHCFFRQAGSCSSLLERYPVVPITTSLEMLIRAALDLAPGRVAVSVNDLHSYRWLAVFQPVEATIRADFDGIDKVAVAMDGYLDASVILAAAFPARTGSPLSPLVGERPAPTTAERLYGDHWMFHGPSFQGVVELGPMGKNGIHGRIRAGSAPGATLDNAGQLLGYWICVATESNRLAVPTSIDEIRFFCPAPSEGASVDCEVRIEFIDQTTVRADMELSYNGGLWCSIRGWEDRRFESDERLWPMVRLPERHLVSLVRPGGYAVFHDAYNSANARDYLSRRFLSEGERECYLTVGPRKQRQWLAGVIVAKDAARAWLWSRGYGPLFPAEISVSEESNRRPVIAGPFQEDLRVSIAHKEDRAVAIVSEGADCGIDIERPNSGSPDDQRESRFLTARNAVSKFLGRHPGSGPHGLEITEVAGDRLRVNGLWVRTQTEGEFMVSWTHGNESN